MNNESDKFDDLLDTYRKMVHVGSVPTPEDNYE